MILFIEVIYNIFYLFLEDRFKHKKILTWLFVLIAITNCFELIFYIYKYYAFKEPSFFVLIKWFKLLHSFLLLILGFMAFVKMKIKKTIFF